MYLSTPEVPVLANHQAMVESFRLTHVSRVLDLGFGGGACYRALRHRRPTVDYTAVERDTVMLKLAREHFGVPLTLPILVENATQWLRRDRASYDLVLCDLFVGEEPPSALQESGFYRSLLERLAPGGVVAMNVLPASEQDALALTRLLCAVFSGVAVGSFADLGNLVFYLRATPFDREPSLEQIAHFDKLRIIQ